MRRAKGFYPLLLIMVFASLASFAFASISFDGGGIKYVAANKGDILFSVDYMASKMYFDNGFVMLNSLDGLFSSIGFSCDTETANMTITKIASMEIDYTVNAPTDVTSTTKIYVGSKGRPSDISGATSWSYNSNSKIVTVSILHQSPSNIIVEWADADNIERIRSNIRTKFFMVMGLMSMVLVIGGAVIVLSVLQGNAFNTMLVFEFLKYAFIIFVGIVVGAFLF